MNFMEIYQELVNGAGVIQSLTANVSQAEAQEKPTPETWSMLEVLCHLYDEEREDFREHLDFILHRQGSEDWNLLDPEAWVVSRKYNEQNFAEIQNKFLEERKKSLDWLVDLFDADWEVACLSPHGTISAGEMLASWAAHDNLHIRQLVEIKRFLIERAAQPYSIRYAGDW